MSLIHRLRPTRKRWARNFSNDRMFEQYCRSRELKPLMKVQDRDADIYIADGGPFDLNDADGKRRAYQTTWMICRGKPDLAKWLEFAPDHDLARFGTNEQLKQQGRVTTALAEARHYLKQFVATERYGNH